MFDWKLVKNTETKAIYDICPHCNNKVTFLPIDESLKDLQLDLCECTHFTFEYKYFGLRKCSHPECGSIIAFSFNLAVDPFYDPFGEEQYDEKVIKLQILPEVDKCLYIDNLPKNIENSFIEAQKCYYNECFIASAILVRKILEEICVDKCIKTGRNMEEKVDTLLNSGKLPSEIGKELHDLRKLGNDGAHIELKHFNNLGKKEVESALSLVSLILEQIYDPKPDNYKLAIEKLKTHKK